MCFFSLITVCLNPGDKLRGTLESALKQTCGDFELIVKDGGSSDGSLEKNRELLKDPRIRVFTEKDTGIYDAMNQAVSHAEGQYIFFLNCGDTLYDETVLEKVKKAAEEGLATEGLTSERCLPEDQGEGGAPGKPGCGTISNKPEFGKILEGNGGVSEMAENEADRPHRQLEAGRGTRQILYGDVFGRKNQAWITPPPSITGFTCYRNVPCHQACFYSASLCKEKPFETKYKIRGDYEHFLWCFYRGEAQMRYLSFPVAEYEGGGYSETKENLRRSKAEHREITSLYMKKTELLKYRLIMALTLAPLRTYLSESPRFAGMYSRLLKAFYRKGSAGR